MESFLVGAPLPTNFPSGSGGCNVELGAGPLEMKLAAGVDSGGRGGDHRHRGRESGCAEQHSRAVRGPLQPIIDELGRDRRLEGMQTVRVHGHPAMRPGRAAMAGAIERDVADGESRPHRGRGPRPRPIYIADQTSRTGRSGGLRIRRTEREPRVGQAGDLDRVHLELRLAAQSVFGSTILAYPAVQPSDPGVAPVTGMTVDPHCPSNTTRIPAGLRDGDARSVPGPGEALLSSWSRCHAELGDRAGRCLRATHNSRPSRKATRSPVGDHCGHSISPGSGDRVAPRRSARTRCPCRRAPPGRWPGSPPTPCLEEGYHPAGGPGDPRRVRRPPAIGREPWACLRDAVTIGTDDPPRPCPCAQDVAVRPTPRRLRTGSRTPRSSRSPEHHSTEGRCPGAGPQHRGTPQSDSTASRAAMTAQCSRGDRLIHASNRRPPKGRSWPKRQRGPSRSPARPSGCPPGASLRSQSVTNRSYADI